MKQISPQKSRLQVDLKILQYRSRYFARSLVRKQVSEGTVYFKDAGVDKSKGLYGFMQIITDCHSFDSFVESSSHGGERLSPKVRDNDFWKD